MQVVQVNKKLLNPFINFPDRLYKGDDKFVPYMKADQRKTLKKLLFKDKSYTALLVFDGKKVVARILLTMHPNKQLQTQNCCYFSMFECVDDQQTCNLLLDEAQKLAKNWGADCISGTYFPFDQDNRRGILAEGFDRAPLIFTSYNKPYYDKLLTTWGLCKQIDALQYKMDVQNADYNRLKRLANFSKRKFDFRVDTVDWNNVDRDIADVQKVMQLATNEIIYQDAPSIEDLKNIVKEWRRYLFADYILIARKNDTNEPIGIAMALPDFFQVFRKMRGKLDLRGMFVFLTERKRIKSLRAIMHYVLPEYQNVGVAVALYDKMGDSAKLHKINYVEAGTIMENNQPSNNAIIAMGGKLARVYRLYVKKL